MKIQGSHRSKFVVWRVALTVHVQVIDDQEVRLIRPNANMARPGVMTYFFGHKFELCMN